MVTQTKERISHLVSPKLIFATAQLALVLMIFLYLLNVPNTAFLQGLLCGYAIVGNLFHLIHLSRTQKEQQ